MSCVTVLYFVFDMFNVVNIVFIFLVHFEDPIISIMYGWLLLYGCVCRGMKKELLIIDILHIQ